jgi:hypothetical protein
MARKRASRRDPAKEKFWRHAIARQLKSGLTREEFCKREGLNINTFTAWIHIIRKRDTEQAAEKRPAEVSFWLDDNFGKSTTTKAPAQKAEAFLPVFFPDDTACETKQGDAVAEIRIGKATISVFKGADPSTLRSLLTACKEFCD